MLRISKEGRRTMKSLGVSVDPKFWNFDTNQPKPNCPNRQLIRQIVLKYETEYNGKILTKEINEEEFTPQTIVAEQKERIKAQTVEEVYKAIIAELKERGSAGNTYAYLNSYNVLKSFIGTNRFISRSVVSTPIIWKNSRSGCGRGETKIRR